MQQPARQVQMMYILQRKLGCKKWTNLPKIQRPIKNLMMSISCDSQYHYICSYILAVYLFGGGEVIEAVESLYKWNLTLNLNYETHKYTKAFL